MTKHTARLAILLNYLWYKNENSNYNYGIKDISWRHLWSVSETHIQL